MAVITLSREMGSGGDEIAQGMARRLALRLVGREIVNQAARQAGVPEVALAEIDELGLLGIRPCQAACRQYSAAAESLIRALVQEGNLLLLGRGGQAILRDCAGVLHVRVIASLEQRIGRVQAGHQLPAAAAAAMVSACDQARARYLRRHYGVRWDDPQLYDIVLNMAHLDMHTAIEIVCCAAHWQADAARPGTCS